MTVDDNYWNNIPEPTIGRRIIVYFLRVALFPILIISVIYELGNYMKTSTNQYLKTIYQYHTHFVKS